MGSGIGGFFILGSKAAAAIIGDPYASVFATFSRNSLLLTFLAYSTSLGDPRGAYVFLLNRDFTEEKIEFCIRTCLAKVSASLSARTEIIDML